MIFQCDSGVTPDPETELGWWQIKGFPGPSNHNPRIPETDSREPETCIGTLETELRVHKMHDTLE